MKTIKINLYKYEELSDAAKERALSDWSRVNDDPMMPSHMANLLKENLDEKGIKYDEDSINALYSLASCQGDGFMFEGVFPCGAYTATVTHTGRYYHSKSKTVDIVHSDTGEQAPQGVYGSFEQMYQSVCKEMERIGYQEIEYQGSSENFAMVCEGNDYFFEEDGKIHNA